MLPCKSVSYTINKKHIYSNIKKKMTKLIILLSNVIVQMLTFFPKIYTGF